MKVESNDRVRYTGYTPGAIGNVTSSHAVYYHQQWGFDLSFETQVAREMSEFMDRYDSKGDSLWIARNGKHFAGSVAVDGALAHTEGARLRWFIVPPPFHGRGIGAALLNRALAFCREVGHDHLFLWTFQGLAAARTLYEQAGFQLTEEKEGDPWGRPILEQRFDLWLTS